MSGSHRRDKVRAARPALALVVLVAVVATLMALDASRDDVAVTSSEAATTSDEVTVPTVELGEPTTPKPLPQAHELKIKPTKPEKPKKKRLSLAEKAERAAKEGRFPSFSVAMFNILGSQHTAGRRSPYGRGTTRMATATSVLLNRGTSLVGFSEIQRDQLAVARSRMPGYEFYPGEQLGSMGVPQSVAWNASTWKLVEATTITIPFMGQQRLQPVVRLQHLETGSELWFMNVHNAPQGREGERDVAENIEIAKINELAATDIPIVVTGDFNEKLEVLCRFTSATPLVSAVGGGHDGGPCYNPPQRARVDWIFSSPELVREGHVVTRDAPIPSITDHALLVSTLSGE